MRLRSVYFKKLLASFGIVVAVPVLILCVMIYRVGVVRLHKEVEQQQRLLLAQAGESLDVRLSEIEDVALLISMDRQLTCFSSAQDVLETRDGIQKLANFVKANSFIGNILIAPSNENHLYTSDGVANTNVLLEKRYGFGQEEQNIFYTEQQSGEISLRFFPGSGRLMYFIPLETINKQAPGCAVFVLDNASIDGLFSQKQQNAYGSILLLDENNVVMYRKNADSLLEDASFPQKIASATSGVLRYNHGQYTILNQPLENAPWRFVSILPQHWILEKMNIATLGIVLMVVVMLSVVLVTLFAHRHFEPIRSLANYSGLSAKPYEKTDEIAYLHASFSSLKTQMEQHCNNLKNSLMLRLVQEDMLTANEILSALRSLGIFTEMKSCRILVLSVAMGDPALLDALKNFIEMMFGVQDEAHTVMQESGESPAFIVFCSADVVDVVCSNLRTRVEETCNSYAIGISETHLIQEASAAYMEACCALNDQPIQNGSAHERRCTSFFVEDDFEKSLLSYGNSLRLLDADAAYTHLCNLMMLVKRRIVDRMWRYYAFRIAESIVRFGLEDKLFADHTDFPRLNELLSRVLSPETPDAFARLMVETTSMTLRILSDVQIRRCENADERILKWLDEHICNPDLSLDMLSREFGFSQTYWSRRIQELTGMKFSDIIWQRRLEIVKKELRNTALPLKEIVLRAGYCNVSSFSRRFKEEENMTVNQWRDVYRN